MTGFLDHALRRAGQPIAVHPSKGSPYAHRLVVPQIRDELTSTNRSTLTGVNQKTRDSLWFQRCSQRDSQYKIFAVHPYPSRYSQWRGQAIPRSAIPAFPMHVYIDAKTSNEKYIIELTVSRPLGYFLKQLSYMRWSYAVQ
jgi:hypothetical protein